MPYVLPAIPEGDNIRMSGSDDCPVLGYLYRIWNCREVQSLHFSSAISIPNPQCLIVCTSNQGRIVVEESDLSDTTRMT